MTTQARELAKIVSNAGDLSFSDDITLASDASVLNFGADSDVTLTHVADTGLLLNSSRQLQFGDSGTFIRQEADGVLDLTSDTEIELNATTLDINANVDISGTLTVAGALDFGDLDISNVGSIALDTITNDGTDITLDSSGDIILDADGANVKFKDNGTTFFDIQKSGNDAQIHSRISDGDLVFRGNDGGSTITPMTIDMSEGGLVGIGTTSPGSYNSNTNNLVIRDSGSGGITISTGASSTGYVAFNDGEDTTIEGLIAYNQDGDIMSFRTASEDNRLVVKEHGIGVSITPEGAYNGYTSIEFGQQGAIFANDAADDFGLKVNTYLDSGGNWKRKETGVASAIDMDGDQIKIFTAASGSADANITFAQKFRLDNDGLKFGTDTAAANALNDYEEGTWTPNIVGTTGSAGTHALSAGGSGNNYTKIGNRVYFQMSRYVTNKGSYSGKTKVTGLPFTNNGSTATIALSLFPDADYPDTRMVVAQITTNSEIQFYDGARADIAHDWADLGTGYYLNCAGFYLTDS